MIKLYGIVICRTFSDTTTLLVSTRKLSYVPFNVYFCVVPPFSDHFLDSCDGLGEGSGDKTGVEGKGMRRDVEMR